MKNHQLIEISNVLKKYSSFAIFSHANADGDAFGSLLGLGMSLKLLGKKVSYFIPDPVPKGFAFLKDYDLINTVHLNHNDVGILLDASDIGRIDQLGTHFKSFEVTINIDHHETNDYFATYNYIDRHAPSTTCIILKLIETAQLPMDRDISNALYIGLLTDTGSFHYANTTRDAFLTATKLVKYGADPAAIAKKIFEEETLAHLKLIGIALGRISLRNTIVFSYITYSDMKSLNASEEDAEGIINQIRKYKDADVAILFKEVDNEVIRVSLRSKNKNINVQDIAVLFNGGGHAAASGCTIRGNLYKAMEQLLSTAEIMIKDVDKNK